MSTLDLENPATRASCLSAAALAPPTGATGAPFEDRQIAIVCSPNCFASAGLSMLLRKIGLGNCSQHFRVSDGTMEALVRDHGVKTYDEYVRAIIEKETVEGIFSVELDWQQFVPLYAFGSYDAYFRSATWIFMTSDDVLRHAILQDASIDQETGESAPGSAHDRSDFDSINSRLLALIENQKEWEKFFGSEGIVPFRVSREQIIAAPAKSVRRIAGYLGREVPPNIDIRLQHERRGNFRPAQAAFLSEALRRRRAATERLVLSRTR